MTRAGDRRMGGFGACLALVLALVAAGAQGEPTVPAERLLAGFAALRDATVGNPFNRPLYLRSGESAGGVSGEVYALLDQPFVLVGSALARPADWCEILLLHLNTKYCRPSVEDGNAVLGLRVGTRHDQPLADAYRLDFAWRVTARRDDYLAVSLVAETGPLDTRDYRIVLEAAPASAGRTVIRLSYAYAYGAMGRFAMQVYLATAGRDKVGFTIAGRDGEGRPVFVGGIRGVVERNTLRYCLAIEAHLGSNALPAPARREKSLRDWYAASERHARQLHEVELADYLAMKRREFSRQRALDGAVPG